MILWLTLLLGAAGAYFAVKKSNFYAMWGIAFNILVAISVSVMLSPKIVKMVSSSELSHYHYHCAVCILGLGVIVFVILQIITVALFTGGFNPSMPGLFTNLGTSILGFISGYLAGCFVFLVICIMPFTDSPGMQKAFGEEFIHPAAEKPILAACAAVSKLSMQVYNDRAELALNSIQKQQPKEEKVGILEESYEEIAEPNEF